MFDIRRRFRRKRPKGDHLLDFTADDFLRSSPLELEPEVVLLSRLLRGLSPEAIQVLSESPSSRGWPDRYRLFFDDEDDFPEFRDRCVAALDDFHTNGTPLELSLTERSN
jgi:hypothetical protein